MQNELSENQLMQMAQREEAELANRRAMLGKMLEAIRETANAIDSMKEIQGGAGKVLVRLGSGIFVEAQILDRERCKRSFAEDGYMEEKISDSVEWLSTRLAGMEKQASKQREDMIGSEIRLNEIVGIIKQIQAEKKKLAMERLKNITAK
jgi:prefoldin subunit 5